MNMTTTRRKTNNPPHPTPLSETARSICTLFLLIHLLCVFICLSANWIRSPLQAGLLRVLAPYTQLLNIDLSFTPYHLTHAQQHDVDNFIEIEILPGTTDAARVRLPHVESFQGGKAYHRYKTLADVMAFHALRDDDETTSTLAQSVAMHVLQNHVVSSVGEHPDNAGLRGVVRVRQHTLQATNDLRQGNNNPSADQYYRTAYEADIGMDGDSGKVWVHTRPDEAGEAAPAARKSN